MLQPRRENPFVPFQSQKQLPKHWATCMIAQPTTSSCRMREDRGPHPTASHCLLRRMKAMPPPSSMLPSPEGSVWDSRPTRCNMNVTEIFISYWVPSPLQPVAGQRQQGKASYTLLYSLSAGSLDVSALPGQW